MNGKIGSVLKNDNLISLLSYGVYAFLEAALLYLLAHTYSIKDFGEWLIFYSGITLLDRLIYGVGSFSLVKFLSESIDSNEKKELVGASWIINLSIISILSVISLTLLAIAKPLHSQSGLKLLLIFFPILALVRLPFNQSLATLQSSNSFFNILILRLSGMGLFSLFLCVNLICKVDILYVVIIYVLSFVINAIICFLNDWSGIKDIQFFKMKSVAKLLGFGKYSMGTFIGFNILRESDIIIIAFLMTKTDAALYAIPLRLIDILNVPLMGFIAVAIPRISNASSNNDYDLVRTIYYKYSGILTLLFIPFIVILYFLAPQLIGFFGGNHYIGNETVIHIFDLFLIYGLFMAIDSITGTTLDSINKPQYNFLKVFLMVVVNIIGDLIAVISFKSMVAVAFVTILNLLVGLLIGLIFLKKELNVEVSGIFKTGFMHCMEIVAGILSLKFKI